MKKQLLLIVVCLMPMMAMAQWSEVEMPNKQYHGTLTIGQDRYEGDILNGKPHGNGTMYYANGQKYVGKWAYGRRNGRGTLYYHPDVDYAYTEADWANDVYEGYRKDVAKNGLIVEGNCKNGEWDGEVIWYWPDGRIVKTKYVVGHIVY